MQIFVINKLMNQGRNSVKTSDFFFRISNEPVVFFSGAIRNESTEEMGTKFAMYELPFLQPPVPAVSSS